MINTVEELKNANKICVCSDAEDLYVYEIDKDYFLCDYAENKVTRVVRVAQINFNGNLVDIDIDKLKASFSREAMVIYDHERETIGVFIDFDDIKITEFCY